jgi:hypothetical protein
MSDKAKLTKSQRKRLKRSEKRKASGSPEVENDSHNVSSVSDTKCTGAGSVVRTLDSHDYGRLDNSFYTDSERYVNSVLSQTSPTVMNSDQNLPLGYSTPQPHSHAQTIPHPHYIAHQQTMPSNQQAPGWALHIMDDLKTLKISNSKIEQSVNKIEMKISTIENKVTALETKVNDIEQTASFISSEFENQKSSLTAAYTEIANLKSVCQKLDNNLKESKKREETTTDKILDLEARSMRDNLIFYGINETEQNENCEELVKTLIQTKLQLDTTDMQFDRAHRLGGPRARKPRPVVVKFHRYSDRETVRRKSYDENVKASLRGSNQGVGIQSPLQYREARKALTETAQQEKSKGHQTRITGNTLFVNNKPVKKYSSGDIIDL